MKHLSTTVILSFTFLFAQAQTQFLPNADFESWGQQEVEGLFGPEYIYAPDSWFPFGDLFTYLLGQDDDFNMFESNDAHSGNSSVELRPDSVNTYADIVSYMPAGDEPVALRGWYKMNSNIGDTLRILFTLVDSVTNPPQIPLAYVEEFITQPTSAWTEFYVELEYMNTQMNPDSAIVLMGYTANSYTPGNHVLVDNLSLVYPFSVPEIEVELNLYPNPANEVIRIDPLPEDGVISVIDNMGKVISTQRVNGQQKSDLNVSELIPGFYTISYSSNSQFGTSSFCKIN